MKNEEIIEVIVIKIKAGYDEYEIERFLKQQEINLDLYNTLIEAANNEILNDKLKSYPKQNKRTFIFCITLFIVLIITFFFILPSLNISNAIIPLSAIGTIGISLSGFYSLLYYKSWTKDFIEKIGKPKFDLQTYILITSLPTVFFYFIIFWNFTSGSGYNLYKLKMIRKIINLY